MKTVKIKFTDSFGITHDDAVFAVSYGSKNVSKTELVGNTGQTQQSVNVNFQFKYWHSQDAKDENMQAIPLTDRNGQVTFGAYPSTEGEVCDLEEYCLDQLVNVVLKGIDANAKVIS